MSISRHLLWQDNNTCTCAHVHAYTCSYVHIHVHTHMHIYIYIYIYTYNIPNTFIFIFCPKHESLNKRNVLVLDYCIKTFFRQKLSCCFLSLLDAHPIHKSECLLCFDCLCHYHPHQYALWYIIRVDKVGGNNNSRISEFWVTLNFP